MPRHKHARVCFTAEIGEAILDRLAAGEPLLRICGPGRRAGMPDRQTVYQWLRKDGSFYDAYTRARGIGAAAIAEEIVEIADGREPEGGDLIEHRVAFGRQIPGQMPVRATADQRNIGRDWLRITARRWLAGVMNSAAHEARRVRVASRDDALRDVDEPQEQDDLAMAAHIAAVFEAARQRLIREGRVTDGDAAWVKHLPAHSGQS